MNYTPREYTDMVMCYGIAGENARAAERVYARRFPNRQRHPSRSTIASCVRRAQETGILLVDRRNHAGAPIRRNVVDEEEVLLIIEENPGYSVRRIADALNLSRSTVHRILRQNGLHPFHYQRVQQLLAGDAEQRVHFCEGFLAQCRRNASFPDRILWTDECTFTPNGVFNSHNSLYWQVENVIRQGAFRWSINVWVGIMANRVIGPYFLPPRLNGQAYAEFIENSLPILLENVPLHARQNIIYQHDGAPAHFSRHTREILNVRFPNRWIGRGGPIIWPARSPDLNVLDYFVWGYVKSLVEHGRDGTENEVRENIVAAFNSITPDMAYRATRNIVRRAELCIQEGGWHFEQLMP